MDWCGTAVRQVDAGIAESVSGAVGATMPRRFVFVLRAGKQDVLVTVPVEIGQQHA
jgi:hypothetical protein